MSYHTQATEASFIKNEGTWVSAPHAEAFARSKQEKKKTQQQQSNG